MKGWTNLLVAIAGAILLTVIATTTPSPAPADAPATAFSATRAMVDVREIARAPHPTGSEENRRVRAYLTERLESLGMTVTSVSMPLAEKAQARLDKWRGSPARAQATNVIATLEGRDPAKPAVLLMAHHDSVWGSPGAADDAAGVAAILETVRAIRASGKQPERTLMVLLTDAEELGLDGAEHFFTRDPARKRVGVIVNMEARGGGGRTSMFETGDANGAMIDLFARHVDRPVGTSLSVFVYNNLPNYTDYTVAKEQGVPGFNFAFIGRPGLYHSPLITPEALDQGSLQDMGRQVLDLSRGLLDAPALPGKAPDRVFYDLFGLVFLAYPGWVGWLILVVAAGSYAYAGWGVSTLRGMGRGAGAALALTVLGALLLFLGNLASGADGAVNYYDRLAAIPRLEIQAVLLCLAAATLVAGLLLDRRPVLPLLHPIAAPFLLLAAIAQAVAPTAAFPLQIPLLLGGIGAAVMRWRGGATGAWALTIAAMLGVGYLLTLGHALFQAVGADLPFAMVIPLTLGALLLLPLFARIDRARAMKEAAVLTLLALGIALWVRFDAVAPSVAVYSSFN
ncbi:M20/M25/M40 family metallo-hydrolase [Sphingomonas sp. AOB5]|uniref:M20/M25/M40 family metallo-hydrolase n=1 Tax=Sphingomonas sp. AOB5 TaxID=3034017 RepID=UPI0023F8D03C|nr:M20/M25/M40 family metallo-hydrolase [Sphingomonas sp. AOB5]MDF7773673.1 M20/M25/M40 family metallo-hydrolase [Sphingomonas sp. AOB5]